VPSCANGRRTPWPALPACWTAFDPSLPDDSARRLTRLADDLSAFLTLTPDAGLLDEWRALLPQFEEELSERDLLGHPGDSFAAFLDLSLCSPGPAEAVERLLVAYLRWAKGRGFAFAEVHDNHGKQHRVTFEVRGPFAYGWLRGECGGHQLALEAEATGDVLVQVIPDVEAGANEEWQERDLSLEIVPHRDRFGQS